MFALCCLYLVFLSLTFPKLVSSHLDVALVRFHPSDKYFCAYYNATWMNKELPRKPEPLVTVRNVAVADVCLLGHQDTILWKNKVVVTYSDDCFMMQVRVAQGAGAKSLIVLSTELTSFPNANGSLKIPSETGVLKVNTFDLIDVNLSDSTAAAFSPLVGYDGSDIVIWIVAVFLVAVGAYWAQQPRKRETKVAESKRCCNLALVSPFVIIAMVISLLVLLYFFYNIVVWFVLTLFCMASTFALYQIFSSLFSRFSCQWKLPEIKFPCVKVQPTVVSIVFGLIAVAITVTWAVVRHENYSWVLQDVLGAAVILLLIRDIRIQSFKMLTLLLILFMVYDAFMVFITPLLTPDHKSVMVKVAMESGSGHNEKLPLVIRVPKINSDVWSVCGKLEHMLGFGDIAIPGLLVSFCLSFDKVISMRQKHFPSYYVSSLFAYGGGLTIAFTMATMTNEPQPALVYLVPANLLMVLIVGWRRSELKDLWQGINMGMLEAVPVTREDNNPFQQEEIMTSDDEDVNFDKTKLIKTSTV